MFIREMVKVCLKSTQVTAHTQCSLDICEHCIIPLYYLALVPVGITQSIQMENSQMPLTERQFNERLIECFH